MFDKDKHQSFKTACDLLERENNNNNNTKYYPITSVPCFEYWLLLHFEDSCRPYAASGKKSAGDVVERELNFHWRKAFNRDYSKSCEDIFPLLRDRWEEACRRAERHYKEQKQAGTDNPSTLVFKLLKDLEKLKRE